MFISNKLRLENVASEKAKTEREKKIVLDCFRKGSGSSLVLNSLQRYANYLIFNKIYFY